MNFKFNDDISNLRKLFTKEYTLDFKKIYGSELEESDKQLINILVEKSLERLEEFLRGKT